MIGNVMEIKSAQYQKFENEITSITATIDGTVWSVPTTVGNRFYDEIMRQVKEGTLTIKDAD